MAGKSAAKSCTFATNNSFTHITNYSVKIGGAVTKKLEDLSRFNTIYAGGANETSVSITTSDVDVIAGLEIGDMGALSLVVVEPGITAGADKTFTMSNCFVSAIGDISHANSDLAPCEQQITFEICKAAGSATDPTYGWA